MDTHTSHRSLAYALLRIGTGLNFLLHGAVRVFGDLSGFVGGMVSGFEGILPSSVVLPFAYLTTFVELIVGACLLVGLRTVASGAVLMGLMMCLIFGKSLQQDWATVGIQMVYLLLLFVVVFLAEHDRFGISSRKKR